MFLKEDPRKRNPWEKIEREREEENLEKMVSGVIEAKGEGVTATVAIHP